MDTCKVALNKQTQKKEK